MLFRSGAKTHGLNVRPPESEFSITASKVLLFSSPKPTSRNHIRHPFHFFLKKIFFPPTLPPRTFLPVWFICLPLFNSHSPKPSNSPSECLLLPFIALPGPSTVPIYTISFQKGESRLTKKCCVIACKRQLSTLKHRVVQHIGINDFQKASCPRWTWLLVLFIFCASVLELIIEMSCMGQCW